MTPWPRPPRRGSARTDRHRAGRCVRTRAAARRRAATTDLSSATAGLPRARTALHRATAAKSRGTSDPRRGTSGLALATGALPCAATRATSTERVPARPAPTPRLPGTGRRPRVPPRGTARHPHRATGRFHQTPVRDRDGRSAPRRNARQHPARSPAREPDSRREGRRDRDPCRRNAQGRRCHRRDGGLRSARREVLPRAPVIRSEERARRRHRKKVCPAQANTHGAENGCSSRPVATSPPTRLRVTLHRWARPRRRRRRHTRL